ncbi:MAG: hypothetical protein MJ096_02420 [Clostridia bacterium]|nr:hypothetical protein [Clostridia bacterium]
MKKIIISAFALILVLTSCSAGTLFGGSAKDYMGEEVTGEVARDSALWRELEDMLCMLTVNSAELPEFDSMSDSVELCHDSLLNYMFGRGYSKYSGDHDMIEKIEKYYPGYDVICAIPQADFESEMYRCFGGSVKITHRSSTLFRYLEAAEVYVPVTAPISGEVDIVLDTAEETKSSYRLTFTCSAGEKKLGYCAVLVKRDDGTFYFDAVLKK